jgi:hypothetical protein
MLEHNVFNFKSAYMPIMYISLLRPMLLLKLCIVLGNAAISLSSSVGKWNEINLEHGGKEAL